MEHTEYRRIVADADTAVLFIHGIAGTPKHFAPFLPLVPEEYSLVNLLLDGHGGTVRDFSRTSMSAWETQVRNAVTMLSAHHRRIFICAHSMGTLFAIEQAIREPTVSGLFLLAAPLRVFPRPALAVNSAKVFFDWISPQDTVALAARDCYGIERDRNIFHYLGWIPRYLELFRKIREIRGLLPGLSTPTFTFQSGQDEMVSLRSVSDLRKSQSVSVTILEQAGHYYYPPEEMAQLQSRFREFISM